MMVKTYLNVNIQTFATALHNSVFWICFLPFGNSCIPGFTWPIFVIFIKSGKRNVLYLMNMIKGIEIKTNLYSLKYMCMYIYICICMVFICSLCIKYWLTTCVLICHVMIVNVLIQDRCMWPSPTHPTLPFSTRSV